jgi:hypothetical protein
MIDKHNRKMVIALLLLGLSLNLWAHEGHSNTKAVEACHEKELSSGCAYILGKKLYKGSCRVIANKSMCVRSAPIEFLKVDSEPLSKSQFEENNR